MPVGTASENVFMSAGRHHYIATSTHTGWWRTMKEAGPTGAKVNSHCQEHIRLQITSWPHTGGARYGAKLGSTLVFASTPAPPTTTLPLRTSASTSWPLDPFGPAHTEDTDKMHPCYNISDELRHKRGCAGIPMPLPTLSTHALPQHT